jgi:uncharacterized membrane protein
LIAVGVCGFFLALIGLAVAAPLFNSELIYHFFSAACHQISDRCYSVENRPMALCVRCLWIYAGLGLGHLFFAFIRLDEGNSRALLFLGIGLMAGDVAMETLGFYHSLPIVRSVTGFLFGFGCSSLVLRGLTQLCLRTEIKQAPV